MLRRSHQEIVNNGIGNVCNADKVLYWLNIENNIHRLKVKAYLAYCFSNDIPLEQAPPKWNEAKELYQTYVVKNTIEGKHQK